MNHVVKIDQRAFNEGVKETLELRPLLRVVKKALRDDSACKEHVAKGKYVAGRKLR